MLHPFARTLVFTSLLLLAAMPLGRPAPAVHPLAGVLAPVAPAATPAATKRTVFLGGDLSDDNLVVFTANVAASARPGLVLLDSRKHDKYTKAFLEAFRPDQVIPVGDYSEHEVAELEQRLGLAASTALPWKRGPPEALWKVLFPRAEKVVVCPSQPRRLLLQSACLAGVLQAPLVVLRAEDDDSLADLQRRLKDWKTQELFAAGAAAERCKDLPLERVVRLGDEEAVARCYLRVQLKRGPIDTLVVANPADARKGYSPMSSLAPWIAVERRAALVLTSDDGDDTAARVKETLKDPKLQKVETLLLAGDLLAIPMERRPNPVPGKDTHIEMEPFTPTGPEPFTFATGRLFNEDPAVVALVLARERLLSSRCRSLRPEALLAARDAGPSPHDRPRPLKALVASNPGGSLPMLELFSRNTARELENCGFETTALFGHDVRKDDVRRLLPEHDVFLWEGHHSTLIRDYAFPEWNEPLRPSFIFLQSCLALTAEKAQPLLQRGAIGVVGSSTRVYSASGGAFALAYFDALLYDGHSLGGSLRQAKNFLLVYSRLKEKRLGKEARLTGANLRSAWAFTLWGDPSLKLPVPVTAAHERAPVRHRLEGNTIVLELPVAAAEKVATRKYEAQMPPNARLGGLLCKETDTSCRCLTPLVFAEVALPKAPAGRTPRLRSRLPDEHWVFSWDARRGCAYLLAAPPRLQRNELRFQIDWVDEAADDSF